MLYECLMEVLWASYVPDTMPATLAVACEDLTAEQRQEIAKTLSTRAITFETEVSVSAEKE